MSISAEKLPKIHQIQRIASLRYFFWVLKWSITWKITSKLPADALSSYFGIKEWWDNNDLRSKLLFGNFFRIHNSLKLWTRIPESYYVYRSNEAKKELRELIVDHSHTVLVFIGIYPDHNKEFQEAFEQYKALIPTDFNRYLVTNQYDISTYDDDDDILWDYDAESHILLDVPLTMIYIVDQNGTVVWRSTRDKQKESITFLQKLTKA